MAVLVMKIQVDVDPAVVDPHEVAEEIVAGEWVVGRFDRLSAEWETRL